MKLLSLYADGFKKLRFDGQLKFRDGITLIAGLNEAGKSTILDAILYALYGRVTRPSGHVKDADLIAYGSERAIVKLELELQGRRYVVSREINRRKANSAILYELLPDGRLSPKAKGTRPVTSTIEQLLGGITFNEVVSSNVVAQKDLDRLVKLGSNRQREIINAFLNLESFNAVLRELNEERKDLEGTATRPGRLGVERDRLEELNRELEEFDRRREEVVRLEDEVERLEQEVGELKERHQELEALHQLLMEYDEALRREESLRGQLRAKEILLEEGEKRLRRLDERIGEQERQLDEYGDLPSEDLIGKVSALYEGAASSQRQIGFLEGRREEVARQVEEIEGELKAQHFAPTELERARGARRSLPLYGVGTALLLVSSSVSFILGLLPLVALLGALGAFLLYKLISGIKQITKLVKLEGS